jgi:ribosomal protein L11 methylase PrmA
MSLTALRFDVSADDAERWSDALLDAGALSVDATDPRVGTAE